MLLLSSADFFAKLSFQKLLSGTLSECQMVLDVLLDLNWVQAVCKGYQQMTKVAAGKESGFSLSSNAIFL